MSAWISRSRDEGAFFVSVASKEWAGFCPAIQKKHRSAAVQNCLRLSAGMRAIIDEGIVEFSDTFEAQG
jgi:hypothetical protein